MQPSLLLELVEKYFPGLVVSVYEELVTQNDYSFLRDLNVQFSVTGTWESIQGINKNVMADVIALDASIPYKTANPLKVATGDIPKVGTKRQLNETSLTMLQMLIARDGQDTAQVRKQVFEHVAQVIQGQLEKYEYMYLNGLSNGGVVVIDQNTNVGTEIRVNYGMPADNESFASIVWGQANYTPLSDIQAMIDNAAAKGYAITKLKMSQVTFNLIKNSDEAKSLAYPLAQNPPAITASALNDLLLNDYGVTVEIIKKTSVYEKDGVQTVVNPWEAGQIIGLTEGAVGTFVWSEVAEMNFPSNACNYQRAGAQNFILVKKYRTVDPALAEFTASESRALPVIAAEKIFKLDTTATS